MEDILLRAAAENSINQTVNSFGFQQILDKKCRHTNGHSNLKLLVRHSKKNVCEYHVKKENMEKIYALTGWPVLGPYSFLDLDRSLDVTVSLLGSFGFSRKIDQK